MQPGWECKIFLRNWGLAGLELNLGLSWRCARQSFNVMSPWWLIIAVIMLLECSDLTPGAGGCFRSSCWLTTHFWRACSSGKPDSLTALRPHPRRTWIRHVASWFASTILPATLSGNGVVRILGEPTHLLMNFLTWLDGSERVFRVHQKSKHCNIL